MKTASEIKDILREVGNDPLEYSLTAELCKDALTLIESLEARVIPEGAGWISTNDRMPEEGQKVLIWDNDWQDPFVANCSLTALGWRSRYTHWQPVCAPQQRDGSNG